MMSEYLFRFLFFMGMWTCRWIFEVVFLNRVCILAAWLSSPYQAAQWKQYMGPAIIVLFFRNSISHFLTPLRRVFYPPTFELHYHRNNNGGGGTGPFPPSVRTLSHPQCCCFSLTASLDTVFFKKKMKMGTLLLGKSVVQTEKVFFKKGTVFQLRFSHGKSWEKLTKKSDWGNFPVAAFEFVLL